MEGGGVKLERGLGHRRGGVGSEWRGGCGLSGGGGY